MCFASKTDDLLYPPTGDTLAAIVDGAIRLAEESDVQIVRIIIIIIIERISQ